MRLPALSLSEMQKAGPMIRTGLLSARPPAAHPFRRSGDPLPMARDRSGNATTTPVGTVRPAQHAGENEPAAAPFEFMTQ